MNIRIAGEISESIVDGPGIRYVVFTQGCPHNCVGCHNPETHDFDKGTSIDVDEICSRFAKHTYMSGLTISGGEPFAQKSAILSLIKGFKNILFGGEGLFLTTLTGPGRVYLQTMTMPSFAERIIPYLPASRNN